MIPEPRECLNCGEQCCAKAWYSETTTRMPYSEGYVKVYWKCASCGRRFETMEHLESILIEVDRLPDTKYPLAFIKIDE